MKAKQKSNLVIEMISNGVVVSYSHVGEYSTQKQFFETRDRAILWITQELDKEFSWNLEKDSPVKAESNTDEIPF